MYRHVASQPQARGRGHAGSVALVAAFLVTWLVSALPAPVSAADAPPMLTPGKPNVAGFPTPRFYDYIVLDPTSGHYLGVEVKTSIIDAIRLNSIQVKKDAIVMIRGGVARLSGLRISGVSYRSFCFRSFCRYLDPRPQVFRQISKQQAYRMYTVGILTNIIHTIYELVRRSHPGR